MRKILMVAGALLAGCAGEDANPYPYGRWFGDIDASECGGANPLAVEIELVDEDTLDWVGHHLREQSGATFGTMTTASVTLYDDAGEMLWLDLTTTVPEEPAMRATWGIGLDGSQPQCIGLPQDATNVLHPLR